MATGSQNLSSPMAKKPKADENCAKATEDQGV